MFAANENYFLSYLTYWYLNHYGMQYKCEVESNTFERNIIEPTFKLINIDQALFIFAIYQILTTNRNGGQILKIFVLLLILLGWIRWCCILYFCDVCQLNDKKIESYIRQS